MDEAVKLLRELVDLQTQAIRLQKLGLCLQAEVLAYHALASAGADGKPIPRKTVEKTVMGAVKRMRITAEKVAAGKALPK
jgi:hypothetical protein